jgi:hypothetical protein
VHQLSGVLQDINLTAQPTMSRESKAALRLPWLARTLRGQPFGDRLSKTFCILQRQEWILVLKAVLFFIRFQAVLKQSCPLFPALRLVPLVEIDLQSLLAPLHQWRARPRKSHAGLRIWKVD